MWLAPAILTWACIVVASATVVAATTIRCRQRCVAARSGARVRHRLLAGARLVDDLDEQQERRLLPAQAWQGGELGAAGERCGCQALQLLEFETRVEASTDDDLPRSNWHRPEHDLPPPVMMCGVYRRCVGIVGHRLHVRSCHLHDQGAASRHLWLARLELRSLHSRAAMRTMRSSPVPMGDQMATPDRVAAWISALMSSRPRISAHCRSSCAKLVSPDDASHSACARRTHAV